MEELVRIQEITEGKTWLGISFTAAVPDLPKHFSLHVKWDRVFPEKRDDFIDFYVQKVQDQLKVGMSVKGNY